MLQEALPFASAYALAWQLGISPDSPVIDLGLPHPLLPFPLYWFSKARAKASFQSFLLVPFESVHSLHSLAVHCLFSGLFSEGLVSPSAFLSLLFRL